MPITPKILVKFLDTLKSMNLVKFDIKLYKAMFLLAFYAFLRIGEYTRKGKNTKNVILFKDVSISKNKNRVS